MERILLLQLNRLGDLVQTVPLLKRLREDKPGAHVTLACLREFHGILGEARAYCDRLLTVSLGDLQSLGDPDRQKAFPDLPPFDAMPELRERYDLLVNLTNDLGSAVICEKVAAARKLGRIQTYAGELRLLGDWPKYLFAMVSHRVDNLFNLVDMQMGMSGLLPRPMPASLPVSPAALAEARALLAAQAPSATALPGRTGRRLVALQTGANEMHRAWGLEHFAALGGRLLDAGEAEIVLLGADGDRERADRFQALLGRPVIDLVGKTSLPQLPAVLKACDLLVSNDTGTIHVAAAVGTPTLGLYFSTAYYSETAPYGDGHTVLQVEISCAPCHASARCPEQRCREFLPVDAVHAAARWMLDPSRALPPAFPNLSMYRSRFLANGSLLYYPLHPERASSHYRAGFLGRLLWEKALGLPEDPFLAEAWERLRRGEGPEGEGLAARRRALAASLAALEGPFRLGRELAGRLRAEFAGPAPDGARIRLLHAQLAGLGASMAALGAGAGLFGSFLNFEMMDLDFSPYPALAGELETVYGRLCARVAGFQATLARLP